MNLIHEICSQIMTTEIQIHFGETHFTATSEGVLFHPETGIMIISDCHFGKTTHFRKHALPIPEMAMQRDFDRLKSISDHHKPSKLIFLGDLFHSGSNREWEMLSEFLYTQIKLPRILVLGNHDILTLNAYENAGFELTESFTLGSISCTHEYKNLPINTKYAIAGHIHPGFKLKGKAKQLATLPCFYVGQNELIMPAFGSLTGLSVLDKKQKVDRVYCFTPDRIFEVL